MNISNTDANSIVNSKGGLFDVSNEEMEKNIGKYCFYREQDFIMAHIPQKIVGIQKIYTGEIAYRVEIAGKDKDFGRPALASKLNIVEDLSFKDVIEDLKKAKETYINDDFAQEFFDEFIEIYQKELLNKKD